jgi:outer membrane protein assembly factor BamB
MWLVLGPVLLKAEWLEAVDPATQFMVMMFAPMAATALVGLWWLLASRLVWWDRILTIVFFAAAAVGAVFASHSSVGVFGVLLYGLQTALTAWVGWLVMTPFLSWPVRRVGLLVVIALALGYLTMVRIDGVTGTFVAEKNWRWARTAEERFLAEQSGRGGKTTAPAPAGEKVALQAGDWPGFRGPNRDGRLTGVRLRTDWNEQPPRLLWKHLVGPGWSSFTAVGNRIFTQEQRGQEEAVICYDADTGSEDWVYTDPTRFTETVSGPGPRATPTFHDGKVYALGANGTLSCLDAATGKPVWSHDIVPDAGAKVPTWGIACSPLVVHDRVLVFTGAEQGKGMLAYQADSGELAWAKGESSHSYCSPQLVTLCGVEQVLIANQAGVTSFDPVKGDVLWAHGWLAQDTARIVQPALVNDSDVLVGTGMSFGTRRIHLQHEGQTWADQEVWTTKAIKPYFNDLVIHKGHLYGFDGGFLTCIKLENGQKTWRTRGYKSQSGQILLLPDQDLLLVLFEPGLAALVEARPERYKELGHFQALEGKTWNHPVVANGKLFVRNGEMAACYELATDSVK